MKIANLRVCASCEWIFELSKYGCCPMCSFMSYSAHYVYGKKAYRYRYTQEPYKERKLIAFKIDLENRIKQQVYNDK